MKVMVLLIIAMLLNPAVALAQWGDFIKKGLGVGGKSGLSEAKIGNGLKEALKVGTQNTVNLTGQKDGYFANQAIKILMPKTLGKLEKPLRMVGYGPQVDEFVLSMNRAAERALHLPRRSFRMPLPR